MPSTALEVCLLRVVPTTSSTQSCREALTGTAWGNPGDLQPVPFVPSHLCDNHYHLCGNHAPFIYLRSLGAQCTRQLLGTSFTVIPHKTEHVRVCSEQGTFPPLRACLMLLTTSQSSQKPPDPVSGALSPGTPPRARSRLFKAGRLRPRHDPGLLWVALRQADVSPPRRG